MTEKVRSNPLIIKIFLVFFYTVGVVAIYMPLTSSFFMSLTPVALLLSIGLLSCYHENYDSKSVRVFSVIFLAGYLIEVTGVNTGLIFGNYKYGDNLGFQLFNTPLMIGFNWLLMIYVTSSIVEKFKINVYQKVFLASLLMIVYDIILEQLAPKLNFWKWENDNIPFQNYIAWFGIAVFFHSLIKIYKINTSNTLSSTVYLCQLVFFLALMFK